MTSRLFRSLGLMLLLALLVGCVRESTDGDEHLYRYELWASGLVFLAGVIAAPAGWALKESWGRLGWAFLILGSIAALGIAPSMLLDRVAVRPDGFSRHSGIYGVSAVQDVKFADVNHMQLSTVEERGRRGRKVMRTYLICELKDGESVKLPAANNIVMAALPQIVDAAGEAGIMIVGLPTE